MRDQRLDKWAEVLVSYSLGAMAGQTALLLGDIDALPLMEAAYEKFVLEGVKVECLFLQRSQAEFLLKHGSDEQISFTPFARLSASEKYDLYLFIGAISNSKVLSQIDPKRQSLAAAGYKPILDVIMRRAADNKLRWCSTLFPTPAAAQDAEMGNLGYEEFVLDAAFLNDDAPILSWQMLRKSQESLRLFLEGKKELRFQNREGTDLRVNVEGMTWVNCCGLFNFPDGEVFTGPNLKAADGGVNGVARFSMPSIYRNVEVHDIELIFKKGAVVEAKASKNESFLREMIAQDPGAKFVGEIAIGTNFRIQKCTKSILFDEKIGGTFHLALGKGYPETGNCNESALHWDMIFDLREGGTIHADGELVEENGRFARSDWPVSANVCNYVPQLTLAEMPPFEKYLNIF